MTDLFDEVEEQLRSDRYRTLAFKVLPWLLGLVLVAAIAAGAYWGVQRYRLQAASKASEQYEAGLTAINAGRKDEAVRQWGEVAKSSAPGYKALALMELGGLQMADNKGPQAAALFDQAALAAPDVVLGDAARLKSAFAVLDTAPYKDTEARLTPLMQDGHPYRVQAREALAFAKLMAGDTAGARGDFVVIGAMLDAPEGARARAKAAIQLIDSGSAKAVPAAVRAAATLPPMPMPMTPGAPSPGQPQSQAPGPQ